MSLKEKVMTVDLTVSRWGAKKGDRKVTKEVEKANNAHNAGYYTKELIKSATLEDLVTMEGKLRKFHKKHTLPWNDNGTRILPAQRWFEYVGELGPLQIEFNNLVDKFVNEYDELREKAKDYLGEMYNPNDYPPNDIIRSKFKIKVDVDSITDGNDFRIKLDDAVVDNMRKQINNNFEERIEKAAQSMLGRIREVVAHMVERLEEPKNKFHDTLVGNIREVIEMLPKLNFNDDERIKNAVSICKPLIVNPESLRLDLKYRKKICDKAKDVLDALGK